MEMKESYESLGLEKKWSQSKFGLESDWGREAEAVLEIKPLKKKIKAT